jgi:glyoxylase-like metal-dependent hydrolase (beta-lactamase superfamily II)
MAPIRHSVPGVKSFHITWVASLAMGVSALAQRDFSNVEIKATAVSGNVHMLEGAGGNIGVSAGPDGILIIDDQFAPLAEKIDVALGKLGTAKPKYLLNTHWHGDHTGGNAHFGKNALVIAHSNVRKRLADKSDTPSEALPVITYTHSASVHFNGEEIRILHFGPGHTDGDSIVHFTKSNVVHMGDQFFNGRFPFIDLGSGGDVDGYVRTVEAVLQWMPPDAKVIPGHGGLATPADLKAFRDMLVETTTIVRQAKEAGTSLDDVKAKGLPEKWKEWGTGFINTSRWIEITYNSLKKSPAPQK